MIKVALADDHQIFIDGLKSILSTCHTINVVATINDGLVVENFLREQDVDILVLDIDMPNCNGIDLIPKLIEIRADLIILILSMYEHEAYVRAAMKAGAKGYVLKKSAYEDLENAIMKTAQGEEYYCNSTRKLILDNISGINQSNSMSIDISTREAEVLKFVVKGLTNREIADELCVSINTIKTHRRHLIEKLPVKNTIELVTFALHNNLVKMD